MSILRKYVFKILTRMKKYIIRDVSLVGLLIKSTDDKLHPNIAKEIFIMETNLVFKSVWFILHKGTAIFLFLFFSPQESTKKMEIERDY